MIDKEQVQKEQQERIRLGQIAEEGLNNEFWVEIVKPIIDSMIKGLVDIREIKKTLLSSNKKAEVIVEARSTTAEYMSEIETLIRGYIIDSNTVLDMVEKQNKGSKLYKTLG